jgi:hypothetical protein
LESYFEENTIKPKSMSEDVFDKYFRQNPSFEKMNEFIIYLEPKKGKKISNWNELLYLLNELIQSFLSVFDLNGLYQNQDWKLFCNNIDKLFQSKSTIDQDDQKQQHYHYLFSKNYSIIPFLSQYLSK